VSARRTKTKPGGGGDLKFKDKELQTLMDICDDILPMGKGPWETVAHRYNQVYPERSRNEKSLRNQFNSWANKKPPTGDPDCPHFVRLAKLIVKKTKQKAEVSMCDEEMENLASHEMPAIVGRGNTSIASLDGPQDKISKKLTSRDVVSMMMASECMAAKREERFALRQSEERQDNIRLAIGAIGALASAFTGNPVDLSALSRSFGGVPSAVTTTVASSRSRLDSSSDDESLERLFTPMGKKKKHVDQPKTTSQPALDDSDDDDK
jgi:hypothetical protein